LFFPDERDDGIIIVPDMPGAATMMPRDVFLQIIEISGWHAISASESWSVSESSSRSWRAAEIPSGVNSSSRRWRRTSVHSVSLPSSVPITTVAVKFGSAQKLNGLTWLDFDLIKAGELTALTALELAATGRYAGKEMGRRREAAVKKAAQATHGSWTVVVWKRGKLWFDDVATEA
jgi:hypothetical protein